MANIYYMTRAYDIYDGAGVNGRIFPPVFLVNGRINFIFSYHLSKNSIFFKLSFSIIFPKTAEKFETLSPQKKSKLFSLPFFQKQQHFFFCRSHLHHRRYMQNAPRKTERFASLYYVKNEKYTYAVQGVLCSAFVNK